MTQKIPALQASPILSSANNTVGYVQYRAFVGPPWRAHTADDFYDWSALSLAEYEPVPGDSTITASIGAGAATVTLDDASNFPNKGGLWIGPGDGDEGWGYATYSSKSSNTLTFLYRDQLTLEYNRRHSAGAVARFWWPLGTATTEPLFTSSFDSRLSVVTWESQIGGITAPVPTFRPGALFLRQYRIPDTGTESGNWKAWTTDLIGWVVGSSMEDDANRVRTWSMRVASIHWILSTIDNPAIHVGDIGLNDKANIMVSSTLGESYIEANTGEYIGSNVDVSSGALADKSEATPWISGGFVGENNTLPTFTEVQAAANDGIESDYGITQLHLTKYPGQSSGYRWFEITFFKDVSSLTNWIMAGLDYMFILNDFSGSLGETRIFAENPGLFAEEHPESQAGSVVDLGDYALKDMGNKRFTLTNDATSGTFTLTVDVDTTSGLAYDASAATVQSAIEGLAAVGQDNAVVTGSPQDMVVTFVNSLGSEKYSNFPNSYADMTADSSGLSGGTATVTSVHNSENPYDTVSTAASIFDYATYDGVDPSGGMLRILRVGVPGEQGQSQVVWGD